MAVLPTKQIDIPSSFEALEKHLASEQSAGFSIVKIDEHQYKFLADFSLGTLLIKGSPSIVEGIKIYGTFTPEGEEEGTIKVIFKTQLRIELIIIMVIWLIVASKLLPGSQTIPWWIPSILFPALLIWSWFIYRFQENKLKSKVEEYLKAVK